MTEKPTWKETRHTLRAEVFPATGLFRTLGNVTARAAKVVRRPVEAAQRVRLAFDGVVATVTGDHEGFHARHPEVLRDMQALEVTEKQAAFSNDLPCEFESGATPPIEPTPLLPTAQEKSQ